MDDRALNPLKTGMLFVAPGQIMDPGIMKLPQHPDHLFRLKADVGLDGLEAELAGVPEPDWSFRQWLERVGEFVRRRRPSPNRRGCRGLARRFIPLSDQASTPRRGFYDYLTAATIQPNAPLTAGLRLGSLMPSSTARIGETTMNELVSIMQDVAKPATGGSDLARAEARRMDRERERKAKEMAHGPALHPAAILAVGNTEPPVERLMGLQSAFAKAVQFAVGVGQVRRQLPRIAPLRYRPR